MRISDLSSDVCSSDLINRTTRRMDLTEEGKYFFEQAKGILDQMDELEERLSSRQKNPAGRLRINAASPFMLHAIVPHIEEFRGQIGRASRRERVCQYV